MADQQVALDDFFEEETEENAAYDDDYVAIEITRSPTKLRLV